MGELEAGRELDRLIAERVFGLNTEQRQYHEYRADPWACDGCGKRRAYVSRTQVGPCLPAASPYSTDVAAVMTVFEAMVEMTGSGSIEADMEWARGEGFIVNVTLGFDETTANSTGPLPLAICRAALAAREASEREGR